MPRRKNRPTPRVGKIYTRIYKGKEYNMKVVKAGSGVAYSVLGKNYPSFEKT